MITLFTTLRRQSIKHDLAEKRVLFFLPLLQSERRERERAGAFLYRASASTRVKKEGYTRDRRPTAEKRGVGKMSFPIEHDIFPIVRDWISVRAATVAYSRTSSKSFLILNSKFDVFIRQAPAPNRFTP